MSVCGWVWGGDGCLKPPQCVLMGNYECSDNSKGWTKCPQCYNILTMHTHTGHVSACLLVLYLSLAHTHTRILNIIVIHIKSITLLHLLWLSHVLFVLSLFPFLLLWCRIGAPAFHYYSQHFSAYTTTHVFVCVCVSSRSRVSMRPVDIMPQPFGTADNNPTVYLSLPPTSCFPPTHTNCHDRLPPATSH